MGNPPYSVGAGKALPTITRTLHTRIGRKGCRTTYAQLSDTSSVKTLYDSYIRAIR